MFNTSEEIECQREALGIISHGDSSLVGKLLEYHNMILAATFRSVISEFEANLDRCPSAEELIYVTSEKLKENIRNIV